MTRLDWLRGALLVLVLGIAGAAFAQANLEINTPAITALQRSVLRFLDEFGYERLGLSCRLENAVCEMDGVERAPQGYVIVKGGGVPAISVIGYNRAVDWRELVERLKRVTQDNVKPIVK